LKKYFKYLISLFLVFGLTVNDCVSYSRSNTVDYYQFSNVIHKNGSIIKDSELYVLGRVNLPYKASYSIPFVYLEFQDIYSHHIRVLLKIRVLLYQEVSSIIAQSIFINDVITSGNLYKRLS